MRLELDLSIIRVLERALESNNLSRIETEIEGKVVNN